MGLGRDKLDVYGLAIGYVGWVFEHSEKLNSAHRHARDQWPGASQAEGNGKGTEADRGRHFEIARGSTLEWAAIQDVLIVGKALEEKQNRGRKNGLDRMAAMLDCLGKRGYAMHEDSTVHGIDFAIDKP